MNTHAPPGELYPGTKACLLAAMAALTESIVRTASVYAFHRRGDGRFALPDLAAAGRYHMAHPDGCGADFLRVCNSIAEDETISANLTQTSFIAMRAALRFFVPCQALVAAAGPTGMLGTALLQLALEDMETATQVAIDAAVTHIDHEIGPLLEARLREYLQEDGSATGGESSNDDGDYLERLAELGLTDEEVQSMMDETVSSNTCSLMAHALQTHYAEMYGGAICSNTCECTGVDEAVDMPWETTEEDGIAHTIRRLFQDASTSDGVFSTTAENGPSQ